MNFSLRKMILSVIAVNGFSKKWGVYFCIRSWPYLISCYRHEYGRYSLALWPGCHHMHSNRQQKIQYQIINQRRNVIYYRDWSMEQEENTHKKNSTGKVKYGRDANTTITWKLWQNDDVPIIKYLSLKESWKTHDNNKISCSYHGIWSNRTLYFCSIFLTMFTTKVSSLHPTLERHIFLHNK